MSKPRIILAADRMDTNRLLHLVEKIGQHLYAVKIHEMFDRFHEQLIAKLRCAGAQRIWLDLKLHDTPDTVRSRAMAVKWVGADIVTVHASGGINMMRAALEANLEAVYAISVLTSLEADDVNIIYSQPIEMAVDTLANLAASAGVHGLVCSPQEVRRLRANRRFDNLKLVVPGIRLPGGDTHDQKRVGTPFQAMADGADYLVIGRAITEADDPVAACKKIAKMVRLGRKKK